MYALLAFSNFQSVKTLPFKKALLSLHDRKINIVIITIHNIYVNICITTCYHLFITTTVQPKPHKDVTREMSQQ